MKTSRPNQSHPQEQQNNTKIDVHAAARARNWKCHIFAPEVQLTGRKSLNWEHIQRPHKLSSSNFQERPCNSLSCLISILFLIAKSLYNLHFWNNNPDRNLSQGNKRRHRKKTHLAFPHLLPKPSKTMQQGASQYLVSMAPEKGRPNTKDSEITHTTAGYNRNDVTLLLKATIQILHKGLQEMKTLISSTYSYLPLYSTKTQEKQSK